jgi:hypothetical protein
MCLSEDYRPGHALEKILPDGSMTLVVRLDADELRVYEPDGTRQFSSSKGPLISGAHSTFHIIPQEN